MARSSATPTAGETPFTTSTCPRPTTSSISSPARSSRPTASLSCRLLELSACYASEYLSTGRQPHDRATFDARHAWVEAFVPGFSCVGIVRTNSVRARQRHLAVAVGREYSDLPPSRGGFKGEAD